LNANLQSVLKSANFATSWHGGINENGDPPYDIHFAVYG
jgi:hypothetical protein